MHITGDVDVHDLDAWDVRYKGCSLELILEDLLERLGLELGSDSSTTLVEKEYNG